MKMLSMTMFVFVSVFMYVSPVKAELLKLSVYGNCTIYEEIDEFTDELKGFHFICGDDRVFMSLRCNKKDQNSRKWSSIFNGSSRIETVRKDITGLVEGKIRIGKQPTIEFDEAQVYIADVQAYTATSFGWEKQKTVNKIIEGLRLIKPSDKRLIFRAGLGSTEIIALTGKEKAGIDPWLAKCETLVKK